MVFLRHGSSSFSHHDPHHADVYRISRWVEFNSSACRLRYRILRPTEGMLISGWGARWSARKSAAVGQGLESVPPL
jgi:hypothetical protein